MKNGKKYYLIAWIVAVVVFNLIMFLLPNKMLNPTEGAFWVIYLTVTASFIGQAVCSYIYAKKEEKQERFLLIPIAYISYIALLMTLMLALEALTLQFLPVWFTVIVAVVVLAYYALAVFRTLAAAEMVMEVEKDVTQKTEFIHTLTAKAKALESSAPEELRPMAKKVYESLRYSDPMSSAVLNAVEREIVELYGAFSEAVKRGVAEVVEKKADALCEKLNERNELCKSSKR